MSRTSTFLTWMPGVQWIPHDIPADGSGNARNEKPKSKSGRLQFLHPSLLKYSRYPVYRRRVSTISLTGESNKALEARTCDQLESLMFGKLPYELRLMVYEYLVGEGETVHLTLAGAEKKRKYGHFILDEGIIGRQEQTMRECGCKVLVGGGVCRKLSGVLGLAMSCRRASSETIHLLYAPNTFSLLHATHLFYLPSQIPYQRLNSIHTLHLRWTIRALPFLRRPTSPNRYAYPEDTANWIQGWNILSNMQGLRELYVVLCETKGQRIWERGWTDAEEKLMAEVKGVVRPQMFVVVLPYESCRVDGWEWGDCSVELRRPMVEE
ncbi:hypothetical protein M011DRAFT_404597 [Sporormia fimetaria CBS 119925]|uniref:DUF7730 domain-containing protein n=1 Tax=Sporormia fimetaria CBS 119925 TaxID=1340428 RepID=A0A6A6V6G0_9PLEO|nr:hypothetical protein M011DRAFT_404597 [Sporormia fimetaria CBS 119925]